MSVPNLNGYLYSFQSYKGGPKFPMGVPTSKTPELIHLIFSNLITSTVRPDTQNMVAAENAGWGGYMGEVVPSLAFFSFFYLPVILQCVHSLHWISDQCTQNVFWWWECYFGVGLPRGQIYLYPPPKKKKSMG